MLRMIGRNFRPRSMVVIMPPPRTAAWLRISFRAASTALALVLKVPPNSMVQASGLGALGGLGRPWTEVPGTEMALPQVGEITPIAGRSGLVVGAGSMSWMVTGVFGLGIAYAVSM